MEDNPIKSIIGALVDSQTADMKKHSIVYRDLTATATDDLQTLFDIYDLAMSDVTQSMVAVLKERWNITRMSDELYKYIRDFPHKLHDMSREIEKTEGATCCVDKAWSRLLAELPELILASGGTLPAPKPQQGEK